MAFFIPGEQKTRPGTYFRYENWGHPSIAGADDGICAAVFRSNWGPVGEAVMLESPADLARVYGTCLCDCEEDHDEPCDCPDIRTAVALEQFRGGARRVLAVRLGCENEAKRGYFNLQGTGTPATTVMQLTMKYPGERKFDVSIRRSLDRAWELVLFEGGTSRVLERIGFDGTAGSLYDAAKRSNFFTLGELELSNRSVSLAAMQPTTVTPGNEVDVECADYNAAFAILEKYNWNVLAIDCDNCDDKACNEDVQWLMKEYLERVYSEGKFVMGVAGSDNIATQDFNSHQVVYVGNGFIDRAGVVVKGWKAAARVAGMIAGTPSSQSITRSVVAGAVELTQRMSNYQYERAIEAGILTFSTSPSGAVWVESGVNTLTEPDSSQQDNGWRKIKRTKVRFELFQRLNDTVAPLVGRINNDPDGRMTIVQVGNGVCNAMISEGKLLAGAHVTIDPHGPAGGDSASFLVYADDIDALEKMYFTFKFRFAPEEE